MVRNKEELIQFLIYRDEENKRVRGRLVGIEAFGRQEIRVH
jgi:hypothetical protein